MWADETSSGDRTARGRSADRPPPAAPLADVIEAYIRRTGLKRRLDQASAITEWASLVGERIARVTEPRAVLEGGILVVAVKSAAWMQELELHSPEILRRLGERGKPIRRIVWRAMG